VGLGVGVLAPTPNPQSPIPNPQSPIPNPHIYQILKQFNKYTNIYLYIIYLYLKEKYLKKYI
jgi:hypothetical protein